MGRQEFIDEKLLADPIRCAKKLETAVGKRVLPVSDEDLQSLGLLDATAQIGAFVKLKLAICARPNSRAGFFLLHRDRLAIREMVVSRCAALRADSGTD